MQELESSTAALQAAVDMLRTMRDEDAHERRALAEAVSELRTEVARLSARLDAIASDCSRECRPGGDRLSSLEEWRARADAALRVWRFVAGVLGAVIGSVSTLAFQYMIK
jgi:hypothetical protein